MDPSKIVDWIKLKPRYVLALCLATGLLLFGKSAWLDSMGLQAFVTDYRSWLGGVFLIGVALLVAHCAATAFNSVQSRWNERKNLKYGRKRLQQLTTEEKRILNGYLIGKTRTQLLSIKDGVVSGLVSEGIIYRSTNLSSGYGPDFSYNIQPWAWEYLLENPQLVEKDGLSL